MIREHCCFNRRLNNSRPWSGDYALLGIFSEILGIISKAKERINQINHLELMTIKEEKVTYPIVVVQNRTRSKLTVLFGIFIMMSINLSGQISALYNDEGVLIADTNYRIIDQSIFPVMAGRQTAFQYKILTRLNFPPIMTDAGMSGLFIVEVAIGSVSGSDPYKVSSIQFVSEKKYGLWAQSILDDLEFLKEETFFLNGEPSEVKYYSFHIPLKFELFKSDQHKMEKYFEDGVFIYKFYVNEVMLKGAPNIGGPQD